MKAIVALDPGFGAIKLFSEKGSLILPSSVATPIRLGQIQAAGLKQSKPPMLVETSDGAFYVGDRSSDWGRAVATLDFDRLTGSPELRAATYGAFSRLGLPADPIHLVVGLPLAVLQGEAERVQAMVRDVRRWLEGEHRWSVDGAPQTATVSHVRILAQPVGALLDSLFDSDGDVSPLGKAAQKRRIGVINIGMNTVDVLVSRRGELIEGLSGGSQGGVRRLLSLCNRDGLSTIPELDQALRDGDLDLGGKKGVWAREVLGVIESVWGLSWQRFARVVAVGGGAVLLEESLRGLFGELLLVPDDPVIATARGLYKYALHQGALRSG